MNEFIQLDFFSESILLLSKKKLVNLLIKFSEKCTEKCKRKPSSTQLLHAIPVLFDFALTHKMRTKIVRKSICYLIRFVIIDAQEYQYKLFN